jgi:hypothetical protein
MGSAWYLTNWLMDGVMRIASAPPPRHPLSTRTAEECTHYQSVDAAFVYLCGN